ncbi:glycosyltransferase family 4 protein [Pontibacter oryzae]|uniref:Glycosyltransferase family 1 protein n=1 Tax=Pontibacter oryzae TaxID=2304593 RepID=A0A399SIW1_9BACT|nr:glycosyltransferase family 4 protein [Pontibacter oryzae]RIJ42062.1 glycosyltransferase family 1 protein [Pontibacter oryzae]
MARIKILVVGPSLTRTKGGMATVISDMIRNSYNQPGVSLVHAVSHVEGSFFEKLVTTFKGLYCLLTEPKTDIVHIHVASDVSIFRKSLFVYLALFMNKLIVMHVHGGDFDIYYHKCSPMVQYFIRSTFSRCHKILVLSEYWNKFFRQHISSHNVEVLPNGVYPDEFKTVDNTAGTYTDFLFLGKLCQTKGVYDLLAAIDKVINQYKYTHVRFYLAGTGETSKVKEYIQLKGLEEHVQLLGWLDNRQRMAWLQRVGTVVLPSYIEGLPMALIEAMAAGKVVIGSEVGGIPDLVTEGSGFLMKPGDVDALSRHIMFVAIHPEKMEAIAKNNRNIIAAKYNLVKINQRLFKIYRELVLRKRGLITYRPQTMRPVSKKNEHREWLMLDKRN